MTTPQLPQAPGLHGPFIQQRLPDWLKHLKPLDLHRLGHSLLLGASAKGTGERFRAAEPSERATLQAYQQRCRQAARALGQALAGLETITHFAEPRLRQGLLSELQISPDIFNVQFVQVRYVATLPGRQQLLPVQQSLLQAALQNFTEDAEFEAGTALAPHDAFGLELLPGTGVDGSEPRFGYVFLEKLDLEPQRFARLCHQLDLGGQYQRHLQDIYDDPQRKVAIRNAAIKVAKEQLRVQIQLAFLREGINDEVRQLLLGLALGGAQRPHFKGFSVRVSRVRLYGAWLADALFIRTEGDAGRALTLLYLPGAPKDCITRHTSAQAAHDYLRDRLFASRYRSLLSGYLAQADQVRVLSQLNDALFEWVPVHYGVAQRQPNLEAELPLRALRIDGDIFEFQQQLQVQKLKADARHLAVPSADVDEQARAQRLEKWESIGFDLLNAAGFFVPGLGEVMMLAAAVQLVGEVIDGVHAWEDGDLAQAWEHLKSVGLNLGLMLGMGLASHGAASMRSSDLVDGLRVVRLPNGEQRLWKADLDVYASPVEVRDLEPDAQGIYQRDGRSFVRIEGRTLEVTQQADASWSLRHPHDAQAYQPRLAHNRAGAWWLRGESPVGWSRTQLLRRIGHLAEGVDDSLLQMAADISATRDDRLRQMYLYNRPLPPLFSDTLLRLRLDRQIELRLADLRNGWPLDDEAAFCASLAVELPGWPQRAIEVFDAPGLQGAPRFFGHDAWRERPSIKVQASASGASGLLPAILDSLAEDELGRLLGPQTAPQDRLQRLREVLAGYASRQRRGLLERFASRPSATLPADVQRLQRAFPLLTPEVAEELLAPVPRSEREALGLGLQGPSLPLAEQARIHQRDIRLSRAIEGLYQPSLASLDRDRLALGLLSALPGWNAELSLEMRELSLDGQLLQRIGPASSDGPVLLRIGEQYRVVDAQGAELASERSLFAALLYLLSDEQRAALGLTAEHPEALAGKLLEVALGDRALAALAFGQQPIRPWFRSPLRLADGRLGYPMGGRGSSLSGCNRRLRDLFPEVTADGLEQLRNDLLARYLNLGEAVSLLEGELEQLEVGMQEWTAAAHDNIEAGVRESAAARILQAWRNRSSDYTQVLDLSGLMVSRLPELHGRFEHIQELRLSDMHLNEIPSAFLREFGQVQTLALDHNHLLDIPLDISRMNRLQRLDLQGNRLALHTNMLDMLRPLGRLHTLNLGSNGMMVLPSEVLEVFSELTGLRSLNLSNNYLTPDSDILQGLCQLPLQTLDLSDNLIRFDESRAQLFSRLLRLRRLNLSGNPLGMAPELSGLVMLEQLHLRRCLIRDWPPSLTALMDDELSGLRVVDLASNGLREIPDLAHTRFGRGLLGHGRVPNRLLLDGNQLEEPTVFQLEAIGRNLPRPQLTDGPLETWLGRADAAHRDLWNSLFSGRANRPLKDMLERMLLSQEYSQSAEQVNLRIWGLLQAAAEHSELREELLAIAEGFPATCGDAGADAFSELELAALTFNRSQLAASEGARHSGLLALYKQLFRRAQVQFLADRIALRRIVRRRALLGYGEHVPPLDPLDDLDDRVLLRHTVDDVEVRLAIRQELAPRLDYPEPSGGMLYREFAYVSPGLLSKVKRAVRRSETASNVHQWMVSKVSWQRYLKQRFAEQFAIITAFWNEGLDYLDYCVGLNDEPVAKLDRSVLDLLGSSLGESLLDSEGHLRKLDLDELRYVRAADALRTAHLKAEEQLSLNLTRSEELSG